MLISIFFILIFFSNLLTVRQGSTSISILNGTPTPMQRIIARYSNVGKKLDKFTLSRTHYQKKMPPEVLGLEDAYFRENPSIPQAVSRNYNLTSQLGGTHSETSKASKWKGWTYTLLLYIDFVGLSLIFMILILHFYKHR